jgi:hypothetical protein
VYVLVPRRNPYIYDWTLNHYDQTNSRISVSAPIASI